MDIVSYSVQSRWKDCYASSAEAKLTLRTNGEEKTTVITPRRAIVQAGFDAPTTTPTAPLAAGGSLTSGKYYAYRYVYASSNYPYVDNAVTGGGELWPRSNPSSVVVANPSGGNLTVTVTVTKTTRSDVNWIWVYRAGPYDTSAEATDAADYFYIGRVGNDNLTGTTTLTDSGLTDTGEELEFDNFVAPIAQLCVFTGTEWLTWGNWEFVAEVTLNGTSTVTLNSGTWFNGRDAQIATFDGVTNGGFDGKGSFYFKQLDQTTAQMHAGPDLDGALTVYASGTTKIHIKGPATTLYKSKPNNPFSWGWTLVEVVDGATVKVPLLWFLKVGGGYGCAIGVMPNERLLKLDAQEPSVCFTLSLNDTSSPTTMEATKEIVDERYIVNAHFTQFQALREQYSLLMGVDGANHAILQSDGQDQVPASDKVFSTLRTLIDDNNEQRFWHGVYDPYTELDCWWVKTKDLDGNKCDTMIYLHAPTQQWGIMFDPEISASASVYDPVTNERITLVGSEQGHIGRAFDPSLTNDATPRPQYTQWLDPDENVFDQYRPATLAANSIVDFNALKVTTVSDSGGSLNGRGFVLTDTTTGNTTAFIYNINNMGVDPANTSTVSSVNSTTDEITTSAAHPFITADPVFLSKTGGLFPASTPSLNSGIIKSIRYVRNVAASTLKLYPTAADASADTNAYNFTATSFTGTWKISKAPSWVSTEDAHIQIGVWDDDSDTPDNLALNSTWQIASALRASSKFIWNDIESPRPTVAIARSLTTGYTASDVDSSFTFEVFPQWVSSFSQLTVGIPTGREDIWALLVTSAGEEAGWVRYDYWDGEALLVSAFLGAGETESEATIPSGTYTGYFLFPGMIKTRCRAYLNASTPTKNKKIEEIWTTALNIHPWLDSAGLADPRFYMAWFREYDSAAETSFRLDRDFRQGSSTADAASWVSKTSIPSSLLNQFGFELREYGYRQFQLYNITLKYNASS